MTTIDYRSATTLDQDKTYKPSIRELERQTRLMEREKNKIQEFEHLKREWEMREKDYEDSKIREKQKLARRKADLEKLIQEDLEYDPHEDKYHPSCPYFSKSSKGKFY